VHLASAEQMCVQMKHRLSAVRIRIYNHAIAVVRKSFITSDLGGFK